MCGCSGGGGAGVTAKARQSMVKTVPAFNAKALGKDNQTAPGEQRAGDVLAIILFNEGSPAAQSGRQYGWMKRGEQWWIDPKDVETHFKWFRAVELEPA